MDARGDEHSIISESYLERRMSRPRKAVKLVSYEFTRDPGLLHQYYLLRNAGNALKSSALEDAYDNDSHIMVARQGLHCIAGARLTISAPGARARLPMEKGNPVVQRLALELHLSQRTYGEFSGMAVLPDLQDGIVFPEMMRRMIRRAIAEGVEYIFNIAPASQARYYRQTMQVFGLKWEFRDAIDVPESEAYEGSRMMLSMLDLRPFIKARPASLAKREVTLAD